MSNLPARLHMSQALRGVDNNVKANAFRKHKTEVRGRIYAHKRRLDAILDAFQKERDKLTDEGTPSDQFRIIQETISLLFVESQMISTIIQAECSSIDGESYSKDGKAVPNSESVSVADMVDALVSGYESADDVDYLHKDEDTLGKSFIGVPAVFDLFTRAADIDLRLKRRVAHHINAIDDGELVELSDLEGSEDEDGEDVNLFKR